MLLLAPERFSTIIDCPSRSDNHCPISRATISGALRRQSLRSGAPAALDSSARERAVMPPEVRRSPLRDGGIDGVEASSRPPTLPIGGASAEVSIISPRRRVSAASYALKPYA